MASEQATAGVAEHLRESPLDGSEPAVQVPRVRLEIICLAFGVLAFSVYVLATVDTAVSAIAA